MPKIILIVHDVRSAHNVGSLLRSADGFGVDKVYLTGYTPYPKTASDQRLPHLRDKITHQIHKTALGAENSVKWEQKDAVLPLLDELRQKGHQIAALEQTASAVELTGYSTNRDVALIVGSEVGGIEPEITSKADLHLEIPMLGAKESLNVAVAAAVALYHLKFMNSKVDKSL